VTVARTGAPVEAGFLSPLGCGCLARVATRRDRRPSLSVVRGAAGRPAV